MRRKLYIKKVFEDLNKLKRDGFWVSGIIGQGEYREWFEDGTLAYNYFCDNGKKNGTYESWFRNGKRMIQANYKDNVLDDEYKVWEPSGKLKDHLFYKDGEVIKDYLK